MMQLLKRFKLINFIVINVKFFIFYNICLTIKIQKNI